MKLIVNLNKDQVINKIKLMKKSIHKENLEKLHYNNFADLKLRIYLPSKLCRRDVIKNTFNKNCNEKICYIRHWMWYWSECPLLKIISKYIGVDISSEMIRIAKQFCKNLKNVDFMSLILKILRLKAKMVGFNGWRFASYDEINESLYSKKKIDKGQYLLQENLKMQINYFKSLENEMKIDKAIRQSNFFRTA